MRRLWAFVLVVTVAVLMGTAVSYAAPDSLERISRKFTGDLPELLEEHRPIRVLVSYNRTNFFMDKGEARGLEVDSMRSFEKFLRKQHKKDMIRLVFVAVPFDELLPALLDGRGDIVASGLTVTDMRRRKVAFSLPYRTNVSELVVGNTRSERIVRLEDLSGKKIHALAGSSYVEHLKGINTFLTGKGLDPVDIVEADSNLVTEDLLEMVAGKVIQYCVADSHIVDVWKEVMPSLTPYPTAPVHINGTLAWAVRPGDIELLKEINRFTSTVKEGTMLGNMFFKRYYVNTQWVDDPGTPAERSKMDGLIELFQKYGKMYDLDWLKIGALAYQESHFDQSRRSSAGAVGIMQIKPSTAADPNVNIQDINKLENNIHAGTKYLRFLMDRYFKDVDPEARVDFALAAYNAGPAKVARLRKKAEQMGLNPNLWFGNVEWAAYNTIGRETPTYVAHVQMYYAAYKASVDVMTKRIGAEKKAESN